MNHRQWFRTGVGASVLLALCCVTPILFLALTALGLSAWVGWLDVVLVPALVASVVLTWLAWRRCLRDEACVIDAGAETRSPTPRP